MMQRWFFSYCKEKLAHGPEKKQKTENELSIWDIIYTEPVSHDRAEVEVVTLKGTRLLHSIRSMSLPYKVAVRSLSCFCDGCLTLTENPCINSEWVDQWTNKELKLTKVVRDADILLYFISLIWGGGGIKSENLDN